LKERDPGDDEVLGGVAVRSGTVVSRAVVSRAVVVRTTGALKSAAIHASSK
jgi:hypothetical protein